MPPLRFPASLREWSRATCLVLLAVLGMSAWFPAQVINSDSVNGFLAWKGAQLSGQYNTVAEIDLRDASRLSTRFLSWWTPGQYQAPAALQRVTGLPLSYAIGACNALCMALGLLGFHALFRRCALPPGPRLAALLLIATSATVTGRFIIYMGGESLNFALFPWLLLGLTYFNSPAAAALYALAAVLLGFWAKSQMLIALPAALVAQILATLPQRRDGPRLLAVIGGILVAGLIAYFGYLRVTATPASAAIAESHRAGLRLNPLVFLAPLAAPSLVIGNLGDLLNSPAAYARGGLRLLSYSLLAAAVIASMTCAWRSAPGPRRDFARSVVLYWLINAAIFLALEALRAPVGVLARHVKLLGFLWFPVLAWQIAACLPSARRRGLGLALGGLLVTGVLLNHARLVAIWSRHSSVSSQGLRLQSLRDMPAPLSAFLHAQDGGPTTFVFSNYEDRWSIDTASMHPQQLRPDLCLSGRGPRLIAIYPNSNGESDATAAAARQFPAYQITRQIPLAGHFLVFLK